MTTAILIPSLNRPQRLVALVNNIHASTPEGHRLLFAVSDPQSIRILTEMGEWFLDDSAEEDRRYVTRMNKLIEHLTDEDTIFFGSDDVVHHPGWLSKALEVLDEHYHVAVVNDLRNPNGTQAVIWRTYLDLSVHDAPGLAFHPGYHHNYADTEQFYTAWKRGVYIRALDSHVEHLHPIFQTEMDMPWDSTYDVAIKGWDHDSALWQERMALINNAFGPAGARLISRTYA